MKGEEQEINMEGSHDRGVSTIFLPWHDNDAANSLLFSLYLGQVRTQPLALERM